MNTYAFDVLVVPTCHAVLIGLICGSFLLRLIVAFDHLLGSAWNAREAASRRRQGS